MKKEYTIEYKEYWFDCDVEYEEETLHIEANNEMEAIKIGEKLLEDMDSDDNNSGGKYWSDDNPMVSRTFYRCVESKDFSYLSSARNPSLLGFN